MDRSGRIGGRGRARGGVLGRGIVVVVEVVGQVVSEGAMLVGKTICAIMQKPRTQTIAYI